MRVLAIETSCDETSAAVVHRDGDRVTLEGLAILSQDIHTLFGGVVPELASRAHLETIGPVTDDALRQAGADRDESAFNLLARRSQGHADGAQGGGIADSDGQGLRQCAHDVAPGRWALRP